MERIEYIAAHEADRILSKWAHNSASVILAREWGDLAAFEQRRGIVRLAGRAPIHESGETATTIFPARFSEAMYAEDDAYEILSLRRPAGASGLEVTLVMDPTEDLGPDDVLLLVQAARAVRPPVQ